MEIFELLDGCPEDILSRSCDKLKVRVVTQGSKSLVAELKPMSGSFNRVVDGTSTASVSVQIPTQIGAGGLIENCCDEISGISIGRQELEVLFDDEVVWAGPVTALSFSLGTMSLVAEDYTHIWKYRLVDQSVNPIFTDITELVRIYHDIAVNKDAIPGFNLIVSTSGEYAESSVTGSDPQTAYDLISELSEFSIDFTAYGRNVLVGPPSAFPTLPITLTDKDFDTPPSVDMLGPNDGFATQIKAFGQDENNSITVRASDAIIATYGLIERVVEFKQIASKRDLTEAAIAYLNTFKNPFYISSQTGAILSPSTPISFTQLFAGAKIRVSIKHNCKPIETLMRISEVKFDFVNKRTSIALEPISGEFGGDRELSEVVS